MCQGDENFMNSWLLALTPHIDKIAARGTVFTNTYCNSPVCGPSRASMMTGRIPSNVGVYDNAGEFLSSEPTFAHYLRALGYQTTLCGKMHFVTRETGRQ